MIFLSYHSALLVNLEMIQISVFVSHSGLYVPLERAIDSDKEESWPRLDESPWAKSLSPSNISSSRLSTLASPSSLAKWRVSTICQATLCSAGSISSSSPKRPLWPPVTSSSNTCAWKRRWRTVWWLPKPRLSVRRRNKRLEVYYPVIDIII